MSGGMTSNDVIRWPKARLTSDEGENPYSRPPSQAAGAHDT